MFRRARQNDRSLNEFIDSTTSGTEKLRWLSVPVFLLENTAEQYKVVASCCQLFCQIGERAFAAIADWEGVAAKGAKGAIARAGVRAIDSLSRWGGSQRRDSPPRHSQSPDRLKIFIKRLIAIEKFCQKWTSNRYDPSTGISVNLRRSRLRECTHVMLRKFAVVEREWQRLD